MYREPIYTGYSTHGPFLRLSALTLADAWKQHARAAQEDLAYHLQKEAELAEAISCMHWNRLRKKWATKHRGHG